MPGVDLNREEFGPLGGHDVLDHGNLRADVTDDQAVALLQVEHAGTELDAILARLQLGNG
ncbi:hypothetical protein A5784_28815 [Mycobacterium sp. 852013-50091_SCH5140682]|nr:hypothetical protein A5784_28815 [Mycobacterium sp. 852013-50091_SCH5140682]